MTQCSNVTFDICLEKDDWKYRDGDINIYNPSSKWLAESDEIDIVYKFIVSIGEENNRQPEDFIWVTPKVVVNLTQSHLDRVDTGLDDDSI